MSLNSFASSPLIFSPPFCASGSTSMQLVGRFVCPAAPSSSLLWTYTYGTPASSQRIGMCEMTSMGEMSPAITHSLFCRSFRWGERGGGGQRRGLRAGGRGSEREKMLLWGRNSLGTTDDDESPAGSPRAIDAPLGLLAQRLHHLLHAALHLLMFRGLRWTRRTPAGMGQSRDDASEGGTRIGGRVFGGSEGMATRTFFTTLRIFLWKPTSASGFAIAQTGLSAPSPSSLPSFLSFLSFFGVLPSLPMVNVRLRRWH
eukprot:31246-Pelagococcus_subviridis.AAC.12